MAERGRSEAAVAGEEPTRGSTARRIALGSHLRRLREAAGISRADAGYVIRASDSKVSRLELGRVAFKERDVADLLTTYGVTDADEREAFLDMVRQANQPGWWRPFNDVMPNWFQGFVGLEESATRIQDYELQFVPGLLQTEAYMRSILTRGRPEYTPPDAERRITLRMKRQKILTGVAPTKLWAVLDESVLYRPIGGPRTLKEQLEHLLELALLPNVTIQIVPNQLSGYAAEGPFTILRFAEPELPDVVYIEHLSGALYLDNRDEVELYSRTFDRLTVDAETPDRSRQLLTKALAGI
ncbi:helix-turn-helix domain-containing protein [Pseudonocardia asaccharolytica]|uniref:Transcriptional regulator n=1 Tax=Pseudonocardia asaccharolytica DSM 44247 = NBRC 16224 TaxID=1123024 RepID=A0A511D7N4_9PSEU|nr:helix-turn-helix transcriptional regulator [Pseudonocardia asaccharolytica]GEL20772.1 transcriptional regulator [Pseudonocardia asaccharolytica DSM 44247 = NBRC 16224]